ncbi:MAG: hypothetical protein H7Z75_11740 [Ferruginibacter sp.]|nr:hypothetical protein [Cytophagales bacterium]
MLLRFRKKWLFLAALATWLGWVWIDLYAPRQTNIRRFDPGEVARLDARMWRSYYEGKPLALFGQLAGLLRTQYGAPFIRSNAMAYHAAKAAWVFKNGRNRAEYQAALPSLIKFYAAIQEMSEETFEVERVARLELEWWIVHRQRASHPPDKLGKALAETAAVLYHQPAERFAEHARLRAEAMRIRDNRAGNGGLSEADWQRIDQRLHASWRSLWKVVNEPSGQPVALP